MLKEGWENFVVQRGVEPLRGARKSRGAETPLGTMSTQHDIGLAGPLAITRILPTMNKHLKIS